MRQATTEAARWPLRSSKISLRQRVHRSAEGLARSCSQHRKRGRQCLGHAEAEIRDGDHGIGLIRESLDVEVGLGLDLRQPPPARRPTPRRGHQCLDHAGAGVLDGDSGLGLVRVDLD
eukprot:11603541-Alexandrium_andersonii.AAC.2